MSKFDNLNLLTPVVIAEIERKALIGYGDNGHALISPSGAKRWSKCVGSLVGIHEHRRTAVDNVASITGTTAHWLLELCLITRISPLALHASDMHSERDELYDQYYDEVMAWVASILSKDNQPADVVTELKELKRRLTKIDFSYDMREHVNKVWDRIQGYVDIGYQLHPEMKVDLKKYFHHSQCNGSGDVVLYKGSHLIIVDLKYGVVEEVFPEMNEQLMLYGVGACAYVKDKYGIDIRTVTIVVCQPRVNDRYWDEWHTTIDVLLEFTAKMRVASLKALIAIGEPEAITPDMYKPSASTCQYCHRKLTCTSRSNLAMEQAIDAFTIGGAPQPVTFKDSPAKLAEVSDDRLAEIMQLAPFIMSYLKDAEKETHKRVTKGRNIGGRKMVKGRKNRSWIGSEFAVANKLLALGVPMSDVFDRKLLSPAAADNVSLTPEQRKVVESMIRHSYGKPIVALADDRRESIYQSQLKDDIDAFTIK